MCAGDITDALRPLFQPRGQNAAEWAAYTRVLRGARDAGVLPTTVPWLDIRGNHDAFNVPWLGHRNDFFHTSRVSTQAQNESHYVHDVVAP